MILYNVTVNIDAALEQDWLRWMKAEHIPAVMATGLPVSSKVLRLLTELDNGGVTYTVQYFFNTLEDYEIYQNEFSPALQKEHHDRYRDRYVSFRTLLEDA
ncbi:DUF4286 family protein [Fibrisoma montanum]|uniref:DUF4286 family protein n=1 Tax=Fibrisoma montanum TaxID=2305895 RepID=A0A418MF61_9BACT|nr:DUF4286 family protein [Fibrisoma montanum]RIV25395.1 DUF4286 family protein [Fibrisoma montanum]